MLTCKKHGLILMRQEGGRRDGEGGSLLIMSRMDFMYKRGLHLVELRNAKNMMKE